MRPVRRSRYWALTTVLLAVQPPAPGLAQASQGGVRGTTADGIRAPAPLVPFRDLGRAVGDFGSDLWAVTSAPARLDRGPGLALAGVFATGAVLFALDDEIRSDLSSPEPGGFHTTLRDVGDFFEPAGFQGNTNAALAGVALLSYFTRQEWLQRPAKQLLYSQWIGAVIRQGAGYAVGRRRPTQASSAYVFDPGNGTSFPSGHSAVVMEIAAVLSHHLDWRPATVGLYALAGTVVFQRVDSEDHWASDAWIGAGLGYAVARIVIAEEEGRRLRLRPSHGPGGAVGLEASIVF